VVTETSANASTANAALSASRASSFRLVPSLLVIAGVVIASVGLAIGIDYYRLPLEQRPFSPLYDRFRPAGAIGLRYGIVGTVMIAAGVTLYSLRKRLRWLARLGKLKYWLEFHIFVCTVGPFLILLHTSFKVGGLVSIAFWSMTVVALSGIFGRYVYVRIPKSVQGQFASLGEINQQREALLGSLATQLGPRYQDVEAILASARRRPAPGFFRALTAAVRFDFTRRVMLRRVRRILRSTPLPGTTRKQVLDVIGAQLTIEQQLALLSPFQKLFRYWHLFHLPLAIVMFVIVSVHVVIATMFGYGFGGG
jgi:hypothetical protein